MVVAISKEQITEHQQKSFVTLSGFWLLRGLGWEGELSESIKKGKFVTDLFFSDNVERSSKNL